ncbi:hypothetical protein N7536_008778 [Penicillium majusculum]|uniref:Chorismate-utilising enzyme C-terminal domain-containing protein n=1 Tax=Penicillium solitum TaxID=60172 RepID=A0A1V6RBV8_9EURO|nr:uncharacterized protein PENSOL_c008G07006 [Penicillium solitum]KAJ5686159.1 hypothetical protein N7536_008778 [Penicillium majusculum]OQD98706.1 hypothetical protein PENSOL_c008G07006 [Penicillium solitum]
MSSQMSITFTSQANVLETVVEVLSNHKTDDYYAYERGEYWYIGIGSRSSLVIDSQGQTVTVNSESGQASRSINGTSIADTAREFTTNHLKSGFRIFGQVGFNYAAHILGQEYTPGNWPLLALLVPRLELVLHRDTTILKGVDEEVKALSDSIQNSTGISTFQNIRPINTEDRRNYTATVENALSDISAGYYKKVIPSRTVEIPHKVNMPATLLTGRRPNNPARSFSLNHAGYQATGFSPEVVVSVNNKRISTEPLAGTRSSAGSKEEVSKLGEELLHDPKEIVEHVVSVREAITELQRLCPRDTVKIEDFMSIRTRGSVQHLGSRITGILSPEKDIWDAFDVVFPSITASGIPKHAALEAIQRLEDQPRELYSGAVIMIEDLESFEAALVLRTVFQDRNRAWIQAGAGVISQSNPQRELTETCEKLASIAPFVIPDVGPT